MTRRRSLGVVAIAAVGTVALAVGIAQGSSGSGGDTQVATIDADIAAADVRPCPGAAPVGQLDPGATVALTGRSEDGAWLQMESPIEEHEQVWIDATLVVVTTPDDLPIVRCGDVDLAIELIGGAELVLTPKTTTTLPPTPGATTTTGATVPGETTTTGPDDEGEDPTTTEAPHTTSPATPTTTRPRTTTTQRPTTTTTTAPPDLTAPTIDTFGTANNRTLIWEAGGPTCVPPQRVQPQARVRDASGVTRVRIIWQVVANIDGQVYFRGNDVMTLVSGDVYRADIGMLNQPLPNGTNGYISWQVLATDGSPAGNEVIVSSGFNIQVRNC